MKIYLAVSTICLLVIAICECWRVAVALEGKKKKEDTADMAEILDPNKEYQGVVKWFNHQKGYGFITTASGKDLFVHYLNIKTDKSFKVLNEGDKVVYNLGVSKDGRPAAVNVREASEVVAQDKQQAEPKAVEDVDKPPFPV